MLMCSPGAWAVAQQSWHCFTIILTNFYMGIKIYSRLHHICVNSKKCVLFVFQRNMFHISFICFQSKCMHNLNQKSLSREAVMCSCVSKCTGLASSYVWWWNNTFFGFNLKSQVCRRFHLWNNCLHIPTCIGTATMISRHPWHVRRVNIYLSAIAFSFLHSFHQHSSPHLLVKNVPQACRDIVSDHSYAIISVPESHLCNGSFHWGDTSLTQTQSAVSTMEQKKSEIQANVVKKKKKKPTSFSTSFIQTSPQCCSEIIVMHMGTIKNSLKIAIDNNVVRHVFARIFILFLWLS